MINSIFVKIIILFVIAILGLGAFSYYFVNKEIKKEMQMNQLKYTQFLATIHQLVRFRGDIELIEKYLNDLDLELIEDPKVLEGFQMYLMPYLNHEVLAKIIKKKNNVLFRG